MLNKFYLIFGVGLLVWYALSALNGWEYDNPRRQIIPLVVLAGRPGVPGSTRTPGSGGYSFGGGSGFGGK
jgi:hypothetical protein